VVLGAERRISGKEYYKGSFGCFTDLYTSNCGSLDLR
jgi:hypothetical protein